MKNKYLTIDLFSGCGGLTDGFEQSSFFKTVACVEWEKEPCRSLEKRLLKKWKNKCAKDIVIHFDIQRTNELLNGWSDDLKYGNHIGLNKVVKNYGEIDVIVGGPPCQAYSLAGRIRDENGMNDDYRNYLFESYLKIVNQFKPKVFVFENVPGILSAKPGGVSIIERITNDFEAIGYSIINNLKENAVYDCSKFGVPQIRKRVIILGVNNNKIKHDPKKTLIDFYNNILPKYKSKKTLTVKDAIGDLPKFYPLENEIKIGKRKFSHSFNEVEINGHEPRMHNKRDIRVFSILCKDIEQGNFKYKSTESLKKLYYDVTGKMSNIHKYHVIQWDKPSNTIPAHLYKDGLRHIHPDSEQARTISVREAARLQSFEDDFEFSGSSSDQYKMIGNAVPPKFAKSVALALNEFLIKYY